MKNLFFISVLVVFVLTGCEKNEDIEPTTPDTDTVYVDPEIGFFEFENNLTDIIILEDEETPNNVNAHAAGNCKVILDNYNISVTVNAQKEIAPDGMPTVYYFFEYEAQIQGYDESTGIVYGTIKDDNDSGEFIYKENKSLELNVKTSRGTYKLYLYNK